MNIEEIRQFMVQLIEDREHAFHVEKLSSQLFDQLGELHGCGLEERSLLQGAALLHDVGLAVSYQKHHKHSLQIILNAEFNTVPKREKRVIANIARYHRKSLPKLDHHEFLGLGSLDQHIVRKMSAILRIAEALDRPHRSAVQEVRCHIDKHSCHCTLFAVGNCMEEKARLSERKDLFLDVYGIDFNIAHIMGEENYDLANPLTEYSGNNLMNPS